jgi:predicted acylesterase/phospholipase RssA
MSNSTEPLLTDPQLYSDQKEFCDIVMKGGITSGVAYPLALCELARHYSFKNIGGTSAGAIAAAAAAAAEYSRRTGRVRTDSGSGFSRLAKLPQWLSEKGNLAGLFQPNPVTRSLFNVLIRSLDLSGSPLRKFIFLLPSVYGNFPYSALLGFVVGLVISIPLLAVATTSEPFLIIYTLVFSLGLVSVLTTFFALLGLVLNVRSAIPQNFYGLTTGYLGSVEKTAEGALTTWLADEIDCLAGKPSRSEPLTFGDLRSAASDLDRELLDHDAESYGVHLQMMTTNLTLGRPYRLPFDDTSGEYFYDPEEWKLFFPPYVVQALERSSVPANANTRLRSLPPAEDLPVVVAARMSLSFPFLISAVPLWTVDYSRKINQNLEPNEVPVLERCLFSDGGISSNFPLHFFDQPLPCWPTFGIDLQEFHPDFPKSPDERNNSYLVRTAGAGRADTWDRFDEKPSGLSRLGGFFVALINTMYNWADNAQVRVPGYRDRVIHIFQTDREGGMNLNMRREDIEALSNRGRFAGMKLRERFTGADGSPLNWDNHRWIRYRSTMALLERMFQSFGRAYNWPHATYSYEEMIKRADTDPPNSYRWRGVTQRDYAAKATEELSALAEEWVREQAASDQSFTKGEPRPTPELSVRPRI